MNGSERIHIIPYELLDIRSGGGYVGHLHVTIAHGQSVWKRGLKEVVGLRELEMRNSNKEQQIHRRISNARLFYGPPQISVAGFALFLSFIVSLLKQT